LVPRGKALVANLAAGLTFSIFAQGRGAVSLASSSQPLATSHTLQLLNS